MKTTTKIEIPENKPDKLTDLADKVLAKSKELGTASPLSNLDMATFEKNLTDGKAKRTEAKKLHDQAETLNQQANLNLGIDKSQNVNSTGSVYSTLASARDILLGIYKGQEKKLTEWGFNVVISEVSNNGRLNKTAK